MSVISDRGCASIVETLLTLGAKPISVQSLAELVNYSPRHTDRIIRYLADDRIGVVTRKDGRKGVPYRYKVNRRKAGSLGFLRRKAA